jgi:hypothetical protein
MNEQLTSIRQLHWDTSMRMGRLVVSLPFDVDDLDADEIEATFALIMRGVRRRVHKRMHRVMVAEDLALRGEANPNVDVRQELERGK